MKSPFSPPPDDTTSSSLDRYPSRKRVTRAQTVNLLPDVPPELKLVEKYNIVSVSGEYRQERVVGMYTTHR